MVDSRKARQPDTGMTRLVPIKGHSSERLGVCYRRVNGNWSWTRLRELRGELKDSAVVESVREGYVPL